MADQDPYDIVEEKIDADLSKIHYALSSVINTALGDTANVQDIVFDFDGLRAGEGWFDIHVGIHCKGDDEFRV